MNLENPPPVLTKKDFTLRYQNGEFGNRTETYHNRDDLVAARDEKSLYHLRNRIAGGATHYNLDFYQAVLLWDCVPVARNWYCSAMAPTSETTFQGEVYRSEKGLSLYYSTIPKPMRESLAEGGIQCYSLRAKLLLEHYLQPDDLEWINTLLERYPSHVCEFSCYNCRTGTLHKHMIVWECRSY